MICNIDNKTLKRWLTTASMFQDDIIAAAGTDFMQKIAEAENRMLFEILNAIKKHASPDEEESC